MKMVPMDRMDQHGTSFTLVFPMFDDDRHIIDLKMDTK